MQIVAGISLTTSTLGIIPPNGIRILMTPLRNTVSLTIMSIGKIQMNLPGPYTENPLNCERVWKLWFQALKEKTKEHTTQLLKSLRKFSFLISE
ncbi:hypothetical protein G9A89_007128 [Geosiphon pyriformis]|nr:hypothetical protein G9A89_007128 [Geosiphon pyriformis]